jgi:hypothetical protein
MERVFFIHHVGKLDLRRREGVSREGEQERHDSAQQEKTFHVPTPPEG